MNTGVCSIPPGTTAQVTRHYAANVVSAQCWDLLEKQPKKTA